MPLSIWKPLFLATLLTLWACDHDHDHPHDDHGHDDHGQSHGNHDDHGHDDEIHFPREYQGKVGLRADAAELRALRPSLAVNARIRPAIDGDHLITAPFEGRLFAPSNGIPEVGASLNAGDIIAFIEPRIGPAEIAALQGEVERAEIELARAEREVERVRDLAASGALPQRRLADAESDLGVARANLNAARERRRQLDSLHHRNSAGRIAIRTPISGVVVERNLVDRGFATTGAPLVRVLDRSTLWLEAFVPEANLPDLPTPTGLWFFSPDRELVDLEIGQQTRQIRAADLIDETTRTANMIFELSTPPASLRVGTFLRVHLYGAPSEEVLTIPRSALLEEDGLPVVFVVQGRESFQRRVISIGAEDGHHVQVLQGLRPGEFVVSQGAYFIRLAAASTDEVGHGHSH